jgi:hypothetical protein
MATIPIPRDFKEFLKLLSSNNVEYLLIGGYAANYHGYTPATAHMDVWIGTDQLNAHKTAAAVQQFGFPHATGELFHEPGAMVRMGVPPLRIEVLTSISGVDFAECFKKRTIDEIDGVPISVISLDDLKANKQASGRLKDLSDLEQLD